MKKGGVKASGAITLVLYFLLLIVAVANLLGVLKVEFFVNLVSDIEILGKIITLISFIFVSFPLMLVVEYADISPELADTLTTAVSIAFVVFCLFMFIWGIKEITLGKKDDYKFARCKKTCAFMHIFKFFTFLYYVGVIVCCFLLDFIKVIADFYAEEMIGVPFIVVIVAGVLALLTFLCFILAVANINKVAKAVKKGELPPDPNANGGDPSYAQNGYDPNAGYGGGQGYQQGPQMQANMPPMNNYQPQYNQQQPQYNTQPQQQVNAGGNSPLIVPGQDGIPYNITQKGLQDLERLERLRQSGTISEANYIVMRTRICNSNLS